MKGRLPTLAGSTSCSSTHTKGSYRLRRRFSELHINALWIQSAFFIQPAACPDCCVKKEGRCLLQILRHQTCIFSTSQYSLEKKWAVWHVCRGAEGKQRSRSRKHPATSECQGCAMPREWMIPGQGTTKRYVLVGKAVRCSLAELDFICLCPLHFLNDAGQITSHRSFHLRYHALC